MGPIDPLAIDVIGLKSAPSGVTDVEEAVDTAALGNSGRVGGTDAPLTGGCIPGGMPGIPCIILAKKKKMKKICECVCNFCAFLAIFTLEIVKFTLLK